ncbi:hypothetical protein CR203_23390 [Salipaludibacillus neizhouensis]|uniref:Butirosin biosynthesis protein H N-terminal domain-containing protein n=1 Tax=Salipaludibacillus neizhouensis TaxID=885475 RepID=A0A3A9KC73_9BACI|nr:hypothetical protein [Salipaludibacillus neizhouensis]RKL64955.1 hypothetical protein CR203_23390 [Salipaludibacillus neizhouensis]
MDVILPRVKSPITSFPSHANLLSVILTKEEHKRWYYSNYTQLFSFGKEYKGCTVDYFPPDSLEYCSLIKKYHLPRELIKKTFNENFNEFLKDCIDDGYYLYGDFNEYYNPNNKTAYKNQYFPHNIMIYGYNYGQKHFLFSGFFNKTPYKNYTISYSNIQKSFFSINTNDNRYKNSNRCDGLMMFKLKENECVYPFEYNKFKTSLEDYIYSNNSINKDLLWNDSKQIVFGSNVYHVVSYFIANFSEQLYYDWFRIIRSLQVLVEHKKVIIEKVLYLENQNILGSSKEILYELKIIERKLVLLRNILLKSYRKKSFHLFRDYSNNLLDIQKNESRCFTELLKNLPDSNNI